MFKKAYEFAYDAHYNQKRNSGQPFFDHPLEVSRILIDYHMDISTICGGLLHDVPEDTDISVNEVELIFGSEVAQLVDGVTKISGIDFDSFEIKQAENLRKIVVSMVNDIRVILIKFADRLHNMRTIQYLPEWKRKRIALETRDIYAPLAHRLGINKISTELEDQALKTLDLPAFQAIQKKLNSDHDARAQIVRKVINKIRTELKKNDIVPVKIYDSQKHCYNTYTKMIERKLPCEEIKDNFSIKVILNDVDDCYFALGIVHKSFVPVHDRFKDYIATPKSNLYQSLHTSVIGPDGNVVEIQIKTQEMDVISEIGVINNWLGSKGKINKKDIEKQFLWLRKILELKDDSNEPADFLEDFKSDLVHDELFVFTPKGDLQRLPRGATPVDFAFHIHSDIGFYCIGAKVNHKMVPLNSQLKNGDIVEIITSDKLQPNPEWIQFVVTAKARSKIKRWMKDIKVNQHTRLGHELLTTELQKLNLHSSDQEMEEIAQSFGMDDTDQLYASIGRHDIHVRHVVTKVLADSIHEGPTNFLPAAIVRQPDANGNCIKVNGDDNATIFIAPCCSPIPGDRILGFFKKGVGVEIHRTECQHMVELMQRPENSVHVEWDSDKQKIFSVRLKIIAQNKPDFLLNLSETIAKFKITMVDMTLNADTSIIHSKLTLGVKNLNQLTQIMTSVLNIKGVVSIERISGEEI